MPRTAIHSFMIVFAVCGLLVPPRLVAAPWRDVLRLNVTESDGIQRASEMADAEALKAIATSARVDAQRSLAMAMSYRVDGELARSDAMARQCLVEADKGTDAVKAVSGYLCSEVLAGNRFLMRDYPAWAHELISGVGRTKEPFDMRYGAGGYRFASLEGLDPITLARIPPMSTDLPAAGVKLPRLLPTFDDGKVELRYDPSGSAPPWVVKATVNGVPVAMRIDTGAVLTNLTAATAERTHVRTLARTFLPLGVGSSGGIVSSALGQVDALSIGSMNAMPWRTAVSSAPDILGSDFLRGLRAFRISETELETINPGKSPNCKAPLRLASGWQGQHLLVGMLDVDGAKKNVLIDTGDDGPLTIYSSGSVSDADPTMTARSLRGERELHYRKGQVIVEGHRVTARRVNGPSGFPFDYVLGAGALRDISLIFNFEAMRLCVLPSSRES